MRILVHEFGGYSFPLQLSRELARRGHSLIHVYPTGLPGPKGRLEPSGGDAPGLQILGLPLSGSFRKYSPIRRLLTQRRYAADLKQIIAEAGPEIVLSADTPIDVQSELLNFCTKSETAFIHWVQDIYWTAIEFFMQKKIGRLSRIAAEPFKRMELSVAKRADSVVAISPDFARLYRQWGVQQTAIHTIPNWAPLDELPERPRDNPWCSLQGLQGKVTFLYSGTLGHKHRPDLLYTLAKSLGPESRVVVVSEGFGRDYLEHQPKLQNLHLLNFQPYDQLPNVLAAADVLVATIDTEASQFAVPSKILSYMCAGRPILFASPEENLSSQTLRRSGGGIAIDPQNTSEWVAAARLLAETPDLRASLGLAARRYAEKNFDISLIAESFENVFERSLGARRPRYLKVKTAASTN